MRVLSNEAQNVSRRFLSKYKIRLAVVRRPRTGLQNHTTVKLCLTVSGSEVSQISMNGARAVTTTLTTLPKEAVKNRYGVFRKFTNTCDDAC